MCVQGILRADHGCLVMNCKASHTEDQSQILCHSSIFMSVSPLFHHQERLLRLCLFSGCRLSSVALTRSIRQTRSDAPLGCTSVSDSSEVCSQESYAADSRERFRIKRSVHPETSALSFSCPAFFSETEGDIMICSITVKSD